MNMLNKFFNAHHSPVGAFASFNAYWSWSDQIVAGVAKGSKYYPRGVTAALWLEESL